MSLQFVVSDDMATGEGLTICILITKAYPAQADYEGNTSRMNEDGSFHFVMPKLREGVTSETIALREFKEEFGLWYAQIAKILTKEEFVENYSKRVPEYILKTIEKEDMGNLYYASKYHVNYS